MREKSDRKKLKRIKVKGNRDLLFEIIIYSFFVIEIKVELIKYNFG